VSDSEHSGDVDAKTPRTDAALEAAKSWHVGIPVPFVQHARQLERELAEYRDFVENHECAASSTGANPAPGSAGVRSDPQPGSAPSTTADMVPLGTISQCPSCGGDGKLTTTPGQFGPCWRCGGYGRVMAYRETDEQFKARMEKVRAFTAGCNTPPEEVRTVKTHDGDEPALLVAASYIRRQGGQHDHACAQCVPHSDVLVDGFVCYYHQALSLLSPQREHLK